MHYPHFHPHAPRLEPWQKKWFRIGLIGAAALAAAMGIHIAESMSFLALALAVEIGG